MRNGQALHGAPEAAPNAEQRCSEYTHTAHAQPRTVSRLDLDADVFTAKKVCRCAHCGDVYYAGSHIPHFCMASRMPSGALDQPLPMPDAVRLSVLLNIRPVFESRPIQDDIYALWRRKNSPRRDHRAGVPPAFIAPQEALDCAGGASAPGQKGAGRLPSESKRTADVAVYQDYQQKMAGYDANSATPDECEDSVYESHSSYTISLKEPLFPTPYLSDDLLSLSNVDGMHSNQGEGPLNASEASAQCSSCTHMGRAATPSPDPFQHYSSISSSGNTNVADRTLDSTSDDVKCADIAAQMKGLSKQPPTPIHPRDFFSFSPYDNFF